MKPITIEDVQERVSFALVNGAVEHVVTGLEREHTWIVTWSVDHRMAEVRFRISELALGLAFAPREIVIRELAERIENVR